MENVMAANETAKDIQGIDRYEDVRSTGANGECIQTEFLKSDYITHHGDFVTACEIARNISDALGEKDDAAYWQRQLNVLQRLSVDYDPQQPIRVQSNNTSDSQYIRVDKAVDVLLSDRFLRSILGAGAVGESKDTIRETLSELFKERLLEVVSKEEASE